MQHTRKKFSHVLVKWNAPGVSSQAPSWRIRSTIYCRLDKIRYFWKHSVALTLLLTYKDKSIPEIFWVSHWTFHSSLSKSCHSMSTRWMIPNKGDIQSKCLLHKNTFCLVSSALKNCIERKVYVQFISRFLFNFHAKRF